jgi:uncharacterized membrane protein YhaH (DUF805 family)
MQALRLPFSPSGRLSPAAFIVSVVVVYLAGAASQGLTVPDVILRAGLWPFIAAQALLIWIWYALHAKRLHDAGRAAGIAAGVAVLYALAVALLIIIAASFYGALAREVPDANTASALGLILFVWIVAVLAGAPHHDLAWLIVVILLLIALLPLMLAIAVTAWAATRPTIEPNIEERPT